MTLLELAFHLGTVPTTWAELLGFTTGAVNVWLVVEIANVILLGLVFVDGGLYADAGLQVVYVALQCYGWWVWLYGGEGRDALPVTRTSRNEWAGLVVAAIGATGVLTWMLMRWTDSTVPFWDALTTALSLTAIYGQSWWIWITADPIYIPLYWYEDLKLTSALCVVGLGAWCRDRVAPVAV